METVVQDVRYAIRQLVRSPGFTLVAVLTLALAIGANSAVFTVVNNVLLQPLPFHDPGRLYAVSYLPTNIPFELPPGLDDRLYLEYRRHALRFERVSGYQRQELTLSGVGDAARLEGARASAEFFDVLGVHPALGRAFAPDEDVAGNDRVVILSDRLWRARFNADRSVVGTTIRLDGIPRTVIGVMPPGFTFPAASQLWTPLALRLDPGNSFLFPVVGRLRPDATPEQAKSELETIARAMPQDPRSAGLTPAAAIIPLKNTVTGKVRTSLLLFGGAVLFVLLIACANVANLLLIRAATRRHEMAIRVALGASRGRLARQLLTESVLIGLLGGAAGILVAFVGVDALLALAPAGRIPRIDEVDVNGWVLGFTLVISLVTGILFGVVPAQSSARREPSEALGQSTRVAGGAHRRLRAAFVTAEIALALVLLTGAGLMIKSFILMRSLDTGYDPRRVVTMAVDLPTIAYPNATRMQAFYTALLERLERIPGVDAVGAVSYRPMGAMGIMGDFSVEGPSPLQHGYSVDKPTVSPGYFTALGIRLLAGRDFTTADRAGAPGVVVISESVARRVWPGQEAVGKRISMMDRPRSDDWLTVIGVVADVVQDAQLSRHSTLYLPYLQTTSPFFINHMTFVVRQGGGPASGSIAPAMRAALRDVDPAVPAQALQTMDASMLETIAEPVFQMRLLTTFALLALLLAALGTYGVLAYDVTERTREVGVRMALGAAGADVLRLIVGEAARLLAAGAVIGLIGAAALTRLLRSLLFGVAPLDLPTFLIAPVVLGVVALLAAAIPARRAARVDPMIALRNE